MRDPNNAVQRRRRLRLLQADADNAGAGPVAVGTFPTDATSTELEGDEEARTRFFQECNGRPGLTLLIEVAGEAHARKICLDRPFLIVGSGVHCDIVIDHPQVMPQHLYLQWIDGRLHGSGLDDLKPFAAWVNRKPVSFGPFRISVPDLDPSDQSQDPSARSHELADEVPQVQLSFAGVEQRDNLWPVDRFLTLIGSGTLCKLRLDHPEIPPVMAALVRTRVGCWLLNLSNSPALGVNESPLVFKSLDIGDAIQLGPFRAEVSVAPFSLKSAKPERVEPRAAIRELAGQHRQRLGALNQSLSAVQVYLDSDHLDGIPELKMALQQYVLHVQRHHREMQDALEKLSSH